MSIRELGALSPVSHHGGPVDHELLNAFLSYLTSTSDGEIPPNGHVWGPMGSGNRQPVPCCIADSGRIQPDVPTNTDADSPAGDSLFYKIQPLSLAKSTFSTPIRTVASDYQLYPPTALA